ncbi:hypothetical protein GOP47_0026559 [Adiantum capillus-veneris]|nr:hypothetical protein GOP47_0026559 [Adiantum capillus-veneris]
MKLLFGLSFLITLLILYRPNVEIHRASSGAHRYSRLEVLTKGEYSSSNHSFSGHGDLESLLSQWQLALRKAQGYGSSEDGDSQKTHEHRKLRRARSTEVLREGLSRRARLYEKTRVFMDLGSKSNSEEVQGDSDSITFMLVTGERPSVCKSAEGAHVLLQSYKNKVEYCSLHGCKVWYMLESWEEGFYGVWARYPALLRLMRSLPSVEWFMWMDADAVFTDYNFSIPFHLYNAWNKNFIAHGFPHLLYGEEGNWFSLNAGIFLIRNCPWSYKFLEIWRELGKRERRQEAKRAFNEEIANRPRDLRADDQSALIYMLRQLRNATQDVVHMEAAYFLHGYYELMVDRYEEMMEKGRHLMRDDEQWPFTTHFCTRGRYRGESGEVMKRKGQSSVEPASKAAHGRHLRSPLSSQQPAVAAKQEGRLEFEEKELQRADCPSYT